MWTGESMTLMESLVVSGMGMTVVMGVLILLALSIVALSRLMTLKQQPAKAPPSAPPAGPSEEEQCAVILSVICEELRADPADIQIKSIRKL